VQFVIFTVATFKKIIQFFPFCTLFPVLITCMNELLSVFVLVSFLFMTVQQTAFKLSD